MIGLENLPKAIKTTINHQATKWVAKQMIGLENDAEGDKDNYQSPSDKVGGQVDDWPRK